MTLDVPLCAGHRSHWSRRVVLNWTVLLIVAVDVILFFLISKLTPDATMGALCFGGFMLVALLLLINMWFDFTNVKPTEITANAITLTNVSADFAADLEKVRQSLPKKEDLDFRKGSPEPPPDDGSFQPSRT